MPSPRLDIRLPDDLHQRLLAYCDEHGLDKSTFARLAISSQLQRKPPKRLPDGVVVEQGNPDIAAARAVLAEQRKSSG